ncbi:hypothetical protein ABZZ36_32360 [Actinacidiphila glaucinigra]|uniref:hypothetical protein n=1 Tax=Actinacidiphila glaucinigra TaxID=235986 RepID=UPI0033BC55DA
MPRFLAPYLAPADEFYSYSVELALGSWSYVVDDGVVYGPGWYPFHEIVEERKLDPSNPLTPRLVPTGKTVPARVRLSPDVEHRSWGNEYVLLSGVDHRARAQMWLFVARRGGGAMTRRVDLVLDLKQRAVELPEQCPEHLRHQAQVKGGRLLDLMIKARAERRRGMGSPGPTLLALGLRPQAS